MKSTDLMIDDWVLYEGSPRKIVLLDDAGLALLRPGEDAEIIVKRDLRPVPLTPEILKNNGFENFGDYYDIPDPSLVIKAVANTFVIGHSINGDFEGFIAIDYVHDLQHALKLCGIEKEIVL